MAEQWTRTLPPDPPKPRDWSSGWDALAIVGVVLLTVAAWLIHPSAGLAVLGVGCLAAAAIGVRVESAERKKKDEQQG